MGSTAEMTEILDLRRKSDKIQNDIYIAAGALGGICGVLLLAVIILIFIAIKLNNKIKAAEEDRRISEEIQARKYSAYTGEEVNRRLHTVNPNVGGPGNNSEYAFNYPVSEYKLNAPMER